MGMGTKFNVEYGPIDLIKYSRRELMDSILDFMFYINGRVHDGLWNANSICDNNEVLGSSSHIFDLSIPYHELIRYMPLVGDIDLCTYKSKFNAFKDMLTNNRFLHNRIGGNVFEIVDFVFKHSYAFILVRLLKLDLLVKFDIEFIDTQGDMQYSRKFRSSNWNDRKIGVKSLFARLLLQSILNIHRLNGKVFDKNGNIIEENPHAYTVSVLGICEKYKFFRSLGSEVELKKDREKFYRRDISNISSILNIPSLNYDELFSFIFLANYTKRLSMDEVYTVACEFVRIFKENDRLVSSYSNEFKIAVNALLSYGNIEFRECRILTKEA